MTAPELVVYLLDWMCSHKATDRAAKDVWSIVRAAVPAHISTATPSFRHVKWLLEQVTLLVYTCVRTQ